MYLWFFSGRNANQTKKEHPPRQPGFQRWKVEFSPGETGKRLLGKVLIVGGKNIWVGYITWELSNWPVRNWRKTSCFI